MWTWFNALEAPLGIAAARAAELNQVAIGFDLSPLIRLGRRPSPLAEAPRRNLELARKFSLTLVITAGARSHLDLGGPEGPSGPGRGGRL